VNLENVPNIWELDLEGLSTSFRAVVFAERAKLVGHELRSNEAHWKLACAKGCVPRSYFIARMGCSKSTLTQNRNVRTIIDELDLQVLRHRIGESDQEIARSALKDAAAKGVADLSISFYGQSARIIKTNHLCRIRDKSYTGIPALLWPEGIDEVASDWFRYMVVSERSGLGSVDLYANALRSFLSYCRQKRTSWMAVDDELLKQWRDHLETRAGPERVNFCLRTVFRFYVWAERTNRTRYHVGIYERNDLPSELDGTAFPISAVKVEGRRGKKMSWTTPWTVPVGSQPEGRRNTPTEEQIRDVHLASATQIHSERNSLILSWAEEVGARRSELLQAKISALPSFEQLHQLIEEDLPWTIEVIRKGGKRWKLLIPNDLLVRTWDYIEGPRAETVTGMRANNPSYIEPDEVFISSTTGAVLHPDSVTSLCGGLFRQAGIRKANVHRLRARFAVRVIETLLDAVSDEDYDFVTSQTWRDTILLKASERMGQMSVASLRPYLNFVLHRRIETSDATRLDARRAKVRQLELRELAALRRVAVHSSLGEAAVSISEGNVVSAAQTLRRLADELERSSCP